MKRNYMTHTIFLAVAMLFGTLVHAEDFQKSFSKNYTVNADAQVLIENQYGNVAIEVWDKNQVEILVTVKVANASEKNAQELLDKVDVAFSGSATQVKAATKINGKLNCRNCEFSIDYEVKMPGTNNLDLTNSFGNAFIGSLEGSVVTNISYGNLNAGKLQNKENSIKLKFGNMDLDHAKAADIEMEYGAMEIGNAGYLDLYVRFASVELGEVSELLLDGQYENVEIGSVNIIRAKTSFMGIEIGEVFEKLEMTNTYGGIEVDRVAAGFSSIDITSEFGGVELGISGSASYSLRVENDFGDVDYPEAKAEVKKYVEKAFHKELEAFVGSDRSSTATVIIKAKNSGVEIN